MTVTDTFEANNDPAGPLTALQTSSFYLSYVTGADDVDFYSYPVPAVAGTRVTFRLSHLEFDGDLVVYGPSGQMLRDERPGTEPLDGQPLDDDGPTLTSKADAARAADALRSRAREPAGARRRDPPRHRGRRRHGRLGRHGPATT